MGDVASSTSPSETTPTPVEPLLDIRDLGVAFGRTAPVHAVVEASLRIDPGERVGLIGESGSGKSVTAMTIMRLLDERHATLRSESSIRFDGREILALSPGELRRLRGAEIGMIFQNPMSSLNPTRRVGKQISQMLERLDDVPKERARQIALDLLEEVGLPDPARTYRAYPHQLSGGMRQRVLIAMVLSREPRLVIADEPTSALDVTVQASLLEMLKSRAEERGISVLMITHDLGVVAQFCERVYVMYGGCIAEEGPVEAVLKRPAHPYTAALARCVPTIAGARYDELPIIPGRQVTRRAVPTACTFADRCGWVVDRCREARPLPQDVAASGTRAACFRSDEVAVANTLADPNP